MGLFDCQLKQDDNLSQHFPFSAYILNPFYIFSREGPSLSTVWRTKKKSKQEKRGKQQNKNESLGLLVSALLDSLSSPIESLRLEKVYRFVDCAGSATAVM